MTVIVVEVVVVASLTTGLAYGGKMAEKKKVNSSNPGVSKLFSRRAALSNQELAEGQY